MNHSIAFIFVLAIGVWLAGVTPGFAQDGRNVLLVINDASPDSQQIGARYLAVRQIPSENVVHLTTSTGDDMDRGHYESEIERPIANWLNRQAAQDRILYIVLTKGIPLRVRGTESPTGTVASVDSELTLLYQKLLGLNVAPSGHIANPYFLGDHPLSEARPFSHAIVGIYLVSRLDGFTVADVLQLIDRGAAPVRDGVFLLDQRATGLGSAGGGDAWLAAAAQELTARGLGDRVVLESTPRVLSDTKQVLGYYSWGSNDPAIKRRRFNFGFVPGSLTATFVSTDARTFKEPPESWTIGAWSDPKTFYAGSPQSLIGDLIREGATGAAGHVAEPYLDATIRPQILFPAYVSGYNLIESFYLAMPYLSWQTVVIGDPLCAPFRSSSLTSEQANPGLDPDTELPKFFSDAHMTILAAQGAAPATSKLLLKADARFYKGDQAGVQQALEAATAAEPRLVPANLRLAMLYEANGEDDKAADRYRLIIGYAPNEFLSLNNLAYLLAVKKANPSEALPMAEKAYRLSNGNPLVADTLGWIHHLMGDRAQAVRLLADAVKGSPQSADAHFHLAAAYQAAGRSAEALAELNKAVELDTAFQERDDVKQLRALLKGK